jgi:hypothetical protein
MVTDERGTSGALRHWQAARLPLASDGLSGGIHGTQHRDRRAVTSSGRLPVYDRYEADRSPRIFT